MRGMAHNYLEVLWDLLNRTVISFLSFYTSEIHHSTNTLQWTEPVMSYNLKGKKGYFSNNSPF